MRGEGGRGPGEEGEGKREEGGDVGRRREDGEGTQGGGGGGMGERERQAIMVALVWGSCTIFHGPTAGCGQKSSSLTSRN